MDDREDNAQQTTAFALLRASAALGALVALAYAILQVWTAGTWSSSAPLSWRIHISLVEGGAPLLLALGCGCVAWGSPGIRRLGLWLIALTITGLILWGVFFDTPDRLNIGVSLAIAAVLDRANRSQIVEAAYRQYSDSLISYASAMSTHSDADVAEEAVHDVFAALLAGQRDDALKRDAAGLRAHLFSAVKQRVETVCRSERRRTHRNLRIKRASSHGLSSAIPTPIPTPAEQYSQTELEQRLRTELENCSKRGVEAFHLVHECGLSYAETAVIMGITTQGVGSHLNRIIHRLRDRLSDWDNNVSPSRPVTGEAEAIS